MNVCTDICSQVSACWEYMEVQGSVSNSEYTCDSGCV